MGLLSLFRSKLGTKDVLAQIQNEMENIEEFKYVSTRREKNYIALLFFVSTLIYIICALLCYFLYFSQTHDITLKILYSLPFLVSPFIVWALKRALHWYYRWRIDTKDERLRELRKQKKKILEKVQETETFKEAKEILEKYDPKLLSDLSMRGLNISSTSMVNNNLTPQLSQMNPQIRYRRSVTPLMPPINRMSTPLMNRPQQYLTAGPSAPMRGSFTPIRPQRLALMAPNYPQTIKPILPQSRGIMEKLVDYVVSDGPSNRYALICIHCHSHNGMALKEEFEYITYKCCYCMGFNPSRKMKPLPPRLGPMTQTNRSSLTPVVDEPESDTESTKGVNTSNDSSKMKIEDITNDNESNINENQKENNDKAMEANNEENIDDVTEIEILDKNEESIDNESEKYPENKDSDFEALESEELTFIDDEPESQTSEKSPVLL